jgi:hypothetical protein
MARGPSPSSIDRLKKAIRQKRAELNLPIEGPIRTGELLEAMKKDPPVEEIVGFVRKSLSEDGPNLDKALDPARLPRRFDRRA